VSNKFPVLEKPWLIDFGKEHHWTILREDGPKTAEKLGLNPEHVSYCRRVDI